MASEREMGEFARQNRRNPTEWEKRLWRHLSNSQLGGFKFRRQAKFPPYISDFFCPSKGLAVELDGAAFHGSAEDRERDTRRDAGLAALGWVVLRFSYRRLTTDPAGCRAEIEAVVRRCLGS